ncbi:MAG: site-2 protease family protein [Woeseiaceae bacterium]
MGSFRVDVLTIIGIAAVVIPSITSHEAAHGFAADYFGDSTARSMGRLTLNPIPHIDPLFTILMPGMLLLLGSPILFGGAKPVPVNVSRLRHPRRDWAIVGAAGPLTNLVLALVFSAAVALLSRGFDLPPDAVVIQALSIGIYFNLLLFLFNLIPIPPLDGSRVLQYFLSPPALAAYQRFERFGLLVIFGLLLLFPATLAVLGSALREVTYLVTTLFGATPVVEAALQALFG